MYYSVCSQKVFVPGLNKEVLFPYCTFTVTGAPYETNRSRSDEHGLCGGTVNPFFCPPQCPLFYSTLRPYKGPTRGRTSRFNPHPSYQRRGVSWNPSVHIPCPVTGEGSTVWSLRNRTRQTFLGLGRSKGVGYG